MKRLLLGTAAVAVPLGFACSPVSAIELHAKDGKNLNLNLSAGTGVYTSGVDYTPQNRDRVTWFEAYGKIGFSGNAPLGDSVEIYGNVSTLASLTTFDGDPAGFSVGDERRIALEDAVLGFKFKDPFGEGSSIDISGGSQYFMLGDGFLIDGDSFNAGNGFGKSLSRGGSYYLAPRQTHRQTAIVKVESGFGLRGEMFYLGSTNPMQGEADLAGLNLEYVDERLGLVGAYFFRVFDADPEVLGGAFARRQDLNTYGFRYQGSMGVENLFLSSEVAFQRGSTEGQAEVEAFAAYGEVSYKFAELPWAPQFGYRYTFYQGDDPETAVSEQFDPLFYGTTRGFGTWVQGEISGSFAGPFSINTGIHAIQSYLHPSDTLRLSALYFNFRGDEPTPFAERMTSQELNLLAEWNITDSIMISPLYGVHFPGDGFLEQFGIEETNHYFQLLAFFNF